MTEHPLTDEICEGLVTFPLESEHDYIEMRAAYDLGRNAQLEQVMKWLDENLCDYNTGATESCPGFFRPMSRLTVDLERAMRPQQQEAN